MSTTNLGLIKPELTDAADITAMNENWDKIDTELVAKVPQVAYYEDAEIEADTILEPFRIIHMVNTNTQLKRVLGASYAYLFTFCYEKAITTKNRIQFAMAYTNNSMATRQYYNGVWSEWRKIYNSNDIVPIANGGTGSSKRNNAYYNLAFIGTDPVTTIDDDTPTMWQDLGSGYARFVTDGLLNNQPSRYGLLMSYGKNSDIFQIWRSIPSGATYWRSGNVDGWGNVWTKVYDANNPPSASEIVDLPTTKTASYIGVAQIGLTEGSETIAEIATKLPTNSMLYYTVSSTSNISEFPNGNYGLLVVDKTTNSRVLFTFTNNLGQQWVGTYSHTANGDTWSDWGSVYNANTPMVLTQYQHYGINLPEPGTEGRIFFKVVG